MFLHELVFCQLSGKRVFVMLFGFRNFTSDRPPPPNGNNDTCIYIILVDCEWGEWAKGDCSTTCGAGQQNNTRVKVIEEAHGGVCNGESNVILSCIIAECPGTVFRQHWTIEPFS